MSRVPSAYRLFCNASPAAWVALIATLGLATASCNKPFKKKEHLALAAPLPAERLIVHNRFGDIVVTAAYGVEQVRAEVIKTGHGTTLADAEAALEEIEISLAPPAGEPGTLLAEARHPRGSSWRGHEVRWHLIAPPGLAIEVHTDFGDVKARGFHDGVKLSSDFGDLEAEAAGRIELKTDFGDVALELLPQNPDVVTVFTDFGDVLMRLPGERTGRLVAQTDFGSLNMHLEGVLLRLVRHRGGHFEAELGGAAGPKIDLASDFGDIEVRCYGAPEEATSER